ncbi:hypothetical protein CNR22_08730 [Sphingobacteriaceae bacterium]|nr:hypothetical protein CNR22_08730 [Sphingobacteriaceae bacterium]
MKKHLLAGLLITGMTAVAQTPRLSLYEEFTGETCPPCAATNPALNALLALPTNTTKIVAIKWQVPIPSAPTATWSLYQTNKTEIDWRWKTIANGGYGYSPAIQSAPSSKIDGQEATVFGATSSHPGYLTSGIITTAQSYTSAFSVTMARAWDATFSSVNLTVNITASANFTATGNLIFRTVMVENVIHFATQPGTNGEKDFEDVAIKSFPTIQNGVSMVGTWITGQTQTFTLNCPIPSYARDKSEIAFVGFIQDDGNQKVAQAVRAVKMPVTNDAKALVGTIPTICGTTVSPQISIYNNGSNIISSFDINPTMNGTNGAIFNWSGSLAPGATTVINLPSTAIIGGVNNFSYTISNVSGSDNNLPNNFAGTKFFGVTNYQGTPVAEGFVGATFPPAGFATYNNYNGPSWAKVTTCGGYGLSANATKLDLFTFPNGSVNELNIPAYHTTSLTPKLHFDVAYAQYASGDADQLDILVSDDCGANWTNVYSKNGAGLMTAPVVTSPFTPSASQWRTDTVFLSGYANKDLLIKFVGTSDYGNNMYLDNINLSSCALQTVVATSNRENICVGETATITATGASSYSWSTSSSTAAVQVVTPSQTTTYMISSKDQSRCKDASTSIVVNVDACTGIKMLNANQLKVTIYPNPSNGETSIIMNANNSGKATVSIVNTLGQVVYKKATTLNSGENTLQLDVKALATGVYNVVIDSEQGSTVKKLTVSK